MASGGYPGSYEKGQSINGLDQTDALIFHGGTKLEDGKVVTNGGRVLTVVTLDDRISTARDRTYKNIEKINFNKMMYRSDIAKPQ